MPWQDYQALKRAEAGESSAEVRRRVMQARSLQLERAGVSNHQLKGAKLSEVAHLDSACERLMEQAANKLKLSMRSCHRLQRVARTIADLENKDEIQLGHLSEALGYRSTYQGV